MKKRAILNKTLNIENIQYEWVAEPGACKVCQAMDGTIYESANNIPDRPHPNCKCHIEIIEKDIDTTDPLENYKILRREKERTIFEIQKAQGDTASLLQEVDECLNQVNKEEQKFSQFQNLVDFDKLDKDDVQMFNKAIEQIEFAKYRGEKAKQQLLDLHQQSIVLEGKIEKINVLGLLLQGIIKSVEVVLGSIISLSRVVKELTTVILNQLKKGNIDTLSQICFKILIANSYGHYHTNKYNMPEALNLYKVASPEYLYNKKYVEKNGELYNSIDELHNYQLEKDIHYRIQQEMGMKDCKVLKLRPDSSLAKKIEQSNTLKKFLKNNLHKLKNQNSIPYQEITFENDDSDLYSAIHGGIFKNVYIDKNTNTLNLTCEDFYNFEFRLTSAKAILGRYLQDTGLLVPYYIIIELKIPESIWKPYI